MKREDIERLLALYAADALTDAERKELYAAALQDQALFDQLAEEDSIRELVAMPGAKARLIASLEEESPVAVAPLSRWFAWASGLALVFVSGGISYLWLERPTDSQQVASVRTDRPPVKTYSPPPVAKESPRAVVDAPPPIAITRQQEVKLPAPIVAPLPATPPPPAPADARERRAANEAPAGPPQEAALGRAEGDSASKAKAAQQVLSSAELEKSRSSFRAAVPAPASAAPKPSKTTDMAAKKEAAPQLSAWRRTGDGVWTRIPADLAVERNSTVAVRYTPSSNGLVSLTNADGVSLMSLNGRAGVELEFVLPQSALANAPGEQLRLAISAARLGAVGGAISSTLRDDAKRQTQPGEAITIRLK